MNRQADDKGRCGHVTYWPASFGFHILHHASQHDSMGNVMWMSCCATAIGWAQARSIPCSIPWSGRGYLVSTREEKVGRSVRKLYRATPYGEAGLALAKQAAQGADGRAPKINR